MNVIKDTKRYKAPGITGPPVNVCFFSVSECFVKWLNHPLGGVRIRVAGEVT